MNCANCNTPLRVIHIEGWCPDCVGKLISHETQFRVRGDAVTMALAYDDWRVKPIGAAGEALPIEEIMRRSFRAGWDARNRVAMLKRNPVGDKPGVCGEIPTDAVAQSLGYLPICLLKVAHGGPHSWGEPIVGMCPKCGARIKPKDDDSGDFEGCSTCGFGLKEDRISPHPEREFRRWWERNKEMFFLKPVFEFPRQDSIAERIARDAFFAGRNSCKPDDAIDRRKNKALAFVQQYVREGCHHNCGENCSAAGRRRMEIARAILQP